ncbi:phosphotransferase family protein [Petropleomorpha daqingensis]|uniref:Aminoglycoside phosphotransferase (APT) family kinase protein n=1 Tax=Petropleomorpha daqingensis TaxID=2026353 RepID=A0A853CJF3_9ACTN|nr:aminoglycoside phosphotransferase (APT) family kinase protein [Petropleomorpha daqingensis]
MEVTGLREGRSPWLLRLSTGAELVLRIGGDRASLATEVAGLRLAGAHGLPVPQLVAADLDRLLVLTTAVPGTSRLSGPPSSARLRAIGAAAAAVHRVPAPPPSPELPVRTQPIGGVDFAALRRAAPVRPLLAEAEAALGRLPVPSSPPVFVHGDLWQGNLLWDGETLTGLVDWDCAGVGPAGVDLGALRCDAATSVGGSAPEEILAGYEQAAGGRFPEVAYWDVVAALATPPTIEWFLDAVRDQGRTDLDQPTMLARRDAFLEAALARL